jgi:hypothetical protein
MSTYVQALDALRSDATIAREDVRRWIDSGDLLTWSTVYAMSGKAWSRIEPEIAAEEQMEFVRRYLLRCIEENPTPGEHLHGGYAAAWQLAACLKLWRRNGGRVAGAIRGIALDLEKIYRRGDASTCNRIVCGVMEHAFEDPAIRPYFVDWDREEDLREAYMLALDWGTAHM